ncbi:MAG TPA: hypothetical protein VGV68_15460 [Terriglobia bacterium]|nr:hypothetical protein [Terriglobia bacterium]
MKTLSRQQLERRKDQAVRFTREVLDDPDRAEEIEGQSLEEYAEGRHIRLLNPQGGRKMAVSTRSELLDKIEELEQENEDLQSRLDEIADLSASEEEGKQEEGEELPRRRNVARAGVNPRRR